MPPMWVESHPHFSSDPHYELLLTTDKCHCYVCMHYNLYFITMHEYVFPIKDALVSGEISPGRKDVQISSRQTKFG